VNFGGKCRRTGSGLLGQKQSNQVRKNIAIQIFVGVGVDSDEMVIGCSRTDVPFGSTTQQKTGGNNIINNKLVNVKSTRLSTSTSMSESESTLFGTHPCSPLSKLRVLELLRTMIDFVV